MSQRFTFGWSRPHLNAPSTQDVSAQCRPLCRALRPMYKALHTARSVRSLCKQLLFPPSLPCLSGAPAPGEAEKEANTPKPGLTLYLHFPPRDRFGRRLVPRKETPGCRRAAGPPGFNTVNHKTRSHTSIWLSSGPWRRQGRGRRDCISAPAGDREEI